MTKQDFIRQNKINQMPRLVQVLAGRLWDAAFEAGRAEGYRQGVDAVALKDAEIHKRMYDEGAKDANHFGSALFTAAACCVMHGCNYISPGTKRSAPFAIFDRDDLLRLTLEMDAWYHEHWQEFSDVRLETIVPAIYGRIDRGADGKLMTTGAQRTGCSVCCFGLHMESRPHRFDKLYQTNPKEWEFWMFTMGLSDVLDYIGVEWQPQLSMLDLSGNVMEVGQ